MVDVVHAVDDAAAGERAEAVEVELGVEWVDDAACGLAGELGELKLGLVSNLGHAGGGGGGIDGVEGDARCEQGVGDELQGVCQQGLKRGSERVGIERGKSLADPDEIFAAGYAGDGLGNMLERADGLIEPLDSSLPYALGLLELPWILRVVFGERGEDSVTVAGEVVQQLEV